MSQIESNSYLQGIRGKFGKIGVYKQIHGKMHMTHTPRPSRKNPSQAQLDFRERFDRAIHYAKRMMEIPEMKTLYETGIKKNKFSAYQVALTDFLKPPVIHEIDASGYTGAVGQPIIVRAKDDFKVKSVQLIIYDPAGAQIEMGAAVLPPEAYDEWQYTTTVAIANVVGIKIVATASDTAGNKTSLEITR